MNRHKHVPSSDFNNKPNDAIPFIFYKPPAPNLNTFQNYRKAIAPQKTPIKTPISSPSKNKQKSQNGHQKNAKSMDNNTTPIYVINNKKNYIIYNDIKCNNSFLTSGGPVICSFQETQKTEFANSDKKTLTDHYQDIFQQFKFNHTQQSFTHQPVNTPSFGTTSTFQKVTLKNHDIQRINDKTHQKTKNIQNYDFSQNETPQKNDNINSDENRKETAKKIQNVANIQTKIKIQNDATLQNDLKERELPNQMKIQESVGQPERKEKVKQAKKIDENNASNKNKNPEIGYSTGDDSQVGRVIERKESIKKAKVMKNVGNDEEEKKFEKKRWDENEDQTLKQAYETFLKSSKKINKWEFVASQFNDRNASQCKQRYKRLVKPDNVRKKWCEAEDKILKSAVEIEKMASWELIAEKLKAQGFPRTGKQVRERYKNQLDPNINPEPFKLEEDLLILNLFKVYGNKWAKIAKHLINRSENAVKNRFHYHLKKNNAFETKDLIYESSETQKIETESLSDKDFPEIFENFEINNINLDVNRGISWESPNETNNKTDGKKDFNRGFSVNSELANSSKSQNFLKGYSGESVTNTNKMPLPIILKGNSGESTIETNSKNKAKTEFNRGFSGNSELAHQDLKNLV